MQSRTESNTQCASPDQQPVGRRKSLKLGRGLRLPRGLIITAVILVLTLGVSVRLKRGKTLPRVAAQSSVSYSNHSRTIRLTGTTEAVHLRAITVPLLSGEYVAQLTITHLISGGSHVKKGDLLAEFDSQAQMREFVDKQSEYEKLANQVLEEQAKENAARAKDETELIQAESSLSKAELEMQKVELLSRIDAEKAQEALDEAKATLQQLRETFDLKRKAAQTGIRVLEIQRDRAQQVMQHAQTNADVMQIRSPMDGVVVLDTIMQENGMREVQEGDQINPGVSFLEVIDPSSMQVRASVNQEDFLSLQIGQPAKIHLDAYPDLVFPGRLEEIAPIARSGYFSSKLRTFAVLFSITGSDGRLMPDLSAGVDIEQATPGNAERHAND